MVEHCILQQYTIIPCFSFALQNNLIKSNQGGLFVRSDSRGSATSLRAWIHHNLFVTNRNRPSLYAEGRQSSPYQEVTIYRNYFSQNAAAFANVIVLRQVVSNFTHNYVHSNRGGRIAEISGFDKVRLPIYQTTSHNGFYEYAFFALNYIFYFEILRILFVCNIMFLPKATWLPIGVGEQQLSPERQANNMSTIYSSIQTTIMK